MIFLYFSSCDSLSVWFDVKALKRCSGGDCIVRARALRAPDNALRLTRSAPIGNREQRPGDRDKETLRGRPAQIRYDQHSGRHEHIYIYSVYLHNYNAQAQCIEIPRNNKKIVTPSITLTRNHMIFYIVILMKLSKTI